MASWLCHLLAAVKAAHLCSDDDERSAFYLGSLAPDASATSQGVNRRDSHFKTSVPGQYLVDDFVRDWCKGVDDRLVRAFRWGYAGHLMVDRLWALRLYIPIVKDDAQAREAYRTDLRAVDRDLAASEARGGEVLDLLRGARRLEPATGAAVGLVEPGEIRALLDKAEVLYRAPWPMDAPLFLDTELALGVIKDGAAELRHTWLAVGCRRS